MGIGYVTNNPNMPVIFPYQLSGAGFSDLMRLTYFYKEEPSKIIDRLVREKATSLLGPKT